ncbi:putative chloride channel-like protein CLC-g [Helianthus annuus]|uniref:putative chloride channel-like protein CLC-g n=1 Tax=Helianthus annuus TaxID=4232 RepID=UPI000B8F717B|nr:putative chloride channel-like protein CLC-g [Helianthus annuus]
MHISILIIMYVLYALSHVLGCISHICCLTLFACLIMTLIAPEVEIAGVDAPAIFSFRSLLVKIAGSIVAVSSGGSKKYGLTWRWLRFFNNDQKRRDLVTCGSAAGIDAAFRAPVGVLFAFEEVAS